MVVLVLAPHTDDGEFGCGGTIAHLVGDGNQVFYAAFSCAEKSVPQEFPSHILREEVGRATAALGILPGRVFVFGYPVREFPKYRQDILDGMIGLRDEITPDLVFLPSQFDIHQDHQVVHDEGLRAFKYGSILGYELPWNNLSFSTTCFSCLSEKQVALKLAALAEYRSQAGRPYATEERIRSLMVLRGSQAGVPFAEAFEVIRWLL